MRRSIWTENYIELRKALKEIRVSNNLSQLELSKLLDKHRTYVTKYENAERNIDFIEVLKICKACKVDPHEFLKKVLSYTEI